MDQKLSDIGEDALISKLVGNQPLPGDVVVGPGDDCAVIDPGPHSEVLQLLKTDCIIESIHFLPGTDPEKVGWKAMARVISDIAAMGGMPHHALVTLALNSDREVAEVEGWYRGMRKAAGKYGECTIVGGETASLPKKGAVISISMTGSVSRDKFATRSGAMAGDLIGVTGLLGGSFKSGRHLDFSPRLFEAGWLMAQAHPLRPTAMMDLSDGLSRDLTRLADMSQIPGFTIVTSSIPIHPGSDHESAVGEGEDYELLITVPKKGAEPLAKEWQKQFPDCPLTFIGELTETKTRTPLSGGWEHFES